VPPGEGRPSAAYLRPSHTTYVEFQRQPQIRGSLGSDFLFLQMLNFDLVLLERMHGKTPLHGVKSLKT
jgi:hypothetical protein